MRTFGKSSKNNIERRSFASILARDYVAQKGFKYGSSQEVADVASRCDIVLTKRHEALVHIIFIMDCQTNPNKKFAADPSQLKAIAERFQNSALNHHVKVVFQLIEVGFDDADEITRDRLRDYQFDTLSGDLHASAWHIGVDTKTVWTTARFNGLFYDTRYIKRLLNKNGVASKNIDVLDQRAQFYFPIFSLALIALMFGIYTYEVAFSGYDLNKGLSAYFKASVDTETLISFGAINRTWILNYFQWYRFIASPFVHTNLFQLFIESSGLLLCGLLLEGLISRVWFFASFALSIFIANYLSLGIPVFMLPRVGFTPGIMGLAVLCVLTIWKVRLSLFRIFAILCLLGVCVLLNLSQIGALIGQPISHFNNLVGALTGLILGLFLNMVWPKWEFMPKFKPFAFMLCLVTLMGCSHGVVKVRYALGLKGSNIEDEIAKVEIPEWAVKALRGPMAVKDVIDKTAGMLNGIDL